MAILQNVLPSYFLIKAYQVCIFERAIKNFTIICGFVVYFSRILKKEFQIQYLCYIFMLLCTIVTAE